MQKKYIFIDFIIFDSLTNHLISRVLNLKTT